jgi:lipopolysaccharide/colanic/teichoic acid biosynthesis glycosyltransferase
MIQNNEESGTFPKQFMFFLFQKCRTTKIYRAKLLLLHYYYKHTHKATATRICLLVLSFFLLLLLLFLFLLLLLSSKLTAYGYA